MTALARRVRAIAARVFCRTTMERILDPNLADIELEHREALGAGRVWAARWSLLRGYAGLCGALALHGVHVHRRLLTPDGAAKRTAAWSAAAFVLLTFALSLPPLLHEGAGLGVFVIPQVIPLSIPIALSVGIASGWSSDATARAMLRRVLVLGLAGTVMALATMEWHVPASGQAWRAAVLRRVAEKDPSIRLDLPRGPSEQSLSELAALVQRASRPRLGAGYEGAIAAVQDNSGAGAGPRAQGRLQLAFHTRLAVCFAPCLLALLAVATAGAIPGRNLARSAFACMVLLYVAAWPGAAAAASTLPPAAVAWLPNAGLVALSALLRSNF